MELYDLIILKKDENQIDENGSALYNLIEPTFSRSNLLASQRHIVTREQEMRIDLISSFIYNTPNYSDLLLNINDIDNPLNIMEGDVINYVDRGLIESLRVSPSVDNNNRRLLLSPSKSNLKDPNRQQYIDNNYHLPPTVLQNPGNPISTADSKITISTLR